MKTNRSGMKILSRIIYSIKLDDIETHLHSPQAPIAFGHETIIQLNKAFQK